MLLTHPDIADTAVIGVNSAKQATELPRAYVVHVRPDSIKTDAEKAVFAASVQKWIQAKVSPHKFLRGGKWKLMMMIVLSALLNITHSQESLS